MLDDGLVKHMEMSSTCDINADTDLILQCLWGIFSISGVIILMLCDFTSNKK